MKRQVQCPHQIPVKDCAEHWPIFDQMTTQQLPNPTNEQELDKILRRIAYWNGYDSAGEWERTGHEVKAQLEEYIANQVKEARLDELQRFDWCDYEGCGAYVHDRLAKLKEQTNDLR